MPLNLPNTKAMNMNLPSKKLLLIGGGILLGIYILWWLVLFVAFDRAEIEQKTLNALRHHFGAEVSFAGGSDYSVTPVPKLVLRNLQIRNNPRARQFSMVQVPYAEITVNLYSLFNSDLVLTLDLLGARIELETFDDGSHSWENNLPPAAENTEMALFSGIFLNDASLHYSYPAVKRDVRLQNLSASLNFPSAQELEANGGFIWNRIYYQFGAEVSGNSDTQQKLKVTLIDGISELTVDGTLNTQTKEASATQEFKTTDFAHFLENFMVTELPENREVPEDKKIPLSITSSLSFKEDKLVLSNIVLESETLQGKGELTALIEKHPHISTQFDFTRFSLDRLVERGVFLELMGSKNVKTDVGGLKVDLPDARKTSLPEGVTVDFGMVASEANIMNMPAKNVKVAAVMENSMITLKQMTAELPGDTKFVVAGNVEGSFDGLALKGQLDIGGADFAAFSESLMGKAVVLPERLKRFRGRGNLFFNPSVMRLSETIFRLEELQLLGTIIHYRKKDTAAARFDQRFEGALRLDNMNLDEWVEAQPEVESGALDGYHPRVRQTHNLVSAVKGMDYAFRINLRDYTLDRQKRPNAAFDLKMEPNRFLLSGIEAVYNDSYISGEVGISFPKNKKRPQLVSRLSVDNFDTARFFDIDLSKDRPFWQGEDGDWSKEEFDFSWLNSFDGEFELNFGQFAHRFWSMSDLRIKAALSDATLQVESLETGLWGGALAMSGRIRAGKLPTFNLKYSLSSMLIEELKGVTDFFGDLKGRVSTSGEITTTGSNVFYALQNSQGSIAVAGRGLTITGFNLANMVRAANTVRTVADIEKLVQFADQGGETTIDTLQGSLNLNGGVLRTPGSHISTQMGDGTISGQVDLIQSSLNMAITIYLSALQHSSPPNVRLVFVGPLRQASRTLDTQSLESFIAKQAAERLLDTR